MPFVGNCGRKAGICNSDVLNWSISQKTHIECCLRDGLIF